ncbi:MAG TPA: zinc ribbon domain-containing protein [Ktedonobacterales bacterium]
MPLYEYYCHDCNARFELLTSYQNADAGIICQECHSPRVRRLLSVVARTRKSGSAGDEFSSASDFGDEGGFGGGSCGCGGGSCGCH